MWQIRFVPEALAELRGIPARERAAISEALLKLEAMGDRLGAPHSSSVKGAAGYLRELRPRRGASAWRVLY
jgi:phage-related protein